MLAIVRSQTVSIRIAWRRQHQFSLIIAVNQPGRETGSAIVMKSDQCDRLILR
ncbi:hypothetical protein [Nostoc sp.]|uniref:hypothetical protein n=1 Tax=Nostoc sp. TaxID=1180 RepID=UPI002FF77F55